MTAQERNLLTVDTIDLPLPADEEQREQVLSGATLVVEEIPQDAGHFSTNYRRC
jgi:hypothetical protein